ncbi:hypothetical protein J7J83_03045 [bacterium]|nr:hypothetical protein [bacterium]
MHIKSLSVSKKNINKIFKTIVIILISILFGYFFGYLNHLYLTREPIKFINEINSKGCYATIFQDSQ